MTRIIAPSAVGSLKKNLSPGRLVIPDQFIDRTKSRPSTFYDGGQIAHVSTADPFCPELRKIALDVGRSLKLQPHDGGTHICIEGPRFSTRAESKMFRQWGADIIGMTIVPECVLSREAEICYVNVATITDYDAWTDEPVSTEAIIETLHKNVEKTKNTLARMISKIPKKRSCGCKNALKGASY